MDAAYKTYGYKVNCLLNSKSSRMTIWAYSNTLKKNLVTKCITLVIRFEFHVKKN